MVTGCLGKEENGIEWLRKGTVPISLAMDLRGFEVLGIGMEKERNAEKRYGAAPLMTEPIRRAAEMMCRDLRRMEMALYRRAMWSYGRAGL